MRPRASKNSSGSMESAGGSQCEIIKEHTEKSTFDDCEFPLFYDSIHKTSDFLWQNKKNNDDGCMLKTSLNKATKEKMNLVIKLTSYRCTYMIEGLVKVPWRRTFSSVPLER